MRLIDPEFDVDAGTDGVTVTVTFRGCRGSEGEVVVVLTPADAEDLGDDLLEAAGR